MSKEFWTQRINNIKKNISLRSVLNHFHVSTLSEDVESQMRCPFHEDDQHPSAKLYETNTMHCFRCDKTWDVLSFVMDKKDCSFVDAVKYLEYNFNISKVSIGDFLESKKDISFLDNKKEPIPDSKELSLIFNKINNKLLYNKKNFTLDQYIEFFHKYDNLYYKFKKEEYNSLKNDLNTLLKEIAIYEKKFDS